MSVRRCVAFMLTGMVVTGCSSTHGLLKEPKCPPSVVRSYGSAELKSLFGDVPAVLDVSGCVESVPLVRNGLFGDSTIGRAPVRPVVEREFKKVLAANARTVFPDETPQLVFSVRTSAVSVRCDGDGASCSLGLSVSVSTCAQGRMKRGFSRDYVIGAESTLRDGLVPGCLYETVQKAARRFVDEMAAAAQSSGRENDRQG